MTRNEAGHSNRSIDRSRRVFCTCRQNGHAPTSSSLGDAGEYVPLLGKQRLDEIAGMYPPSTVIVRAPTCVRAVIDLGQGAVAEQRDVLAGVPQGGTCRRMAF